MDELAVRDACVVLDVSPKEIQEAFRLLAISTLRRGAKDSEGGLELLDGADCFVEIARAATRCIRRDKEIANFGKSKQSNVGLGDPRAAMRATLKGIFDLLQES